MKVIVLGVAGMLGNALFKHLSKFNEIKLYGTMRGRPYNHLRQLSNQIRCDVDVGDMNSVFDLISSVNPDMVINCVGLIKQRPSAENLELATLVNGLFPHQLAKITNSLGIRLVHFSTDCVFSGRVGGYTEMDMPDTQELYGLTKLLGEVVDGKALTIRTSIVGHELSTKHSLLNWFLNENESVSGYKKAFFSGLTTLEVARVIKEIVMPNENLRGLYHLSSNPISKYDLLSLINEIYRHNVKIFPSDDVVLDRTLNAKKFIDATGYVPPSWRDMVVCLRKFYLEDGVSWG